MKLREGVSPIITVGGLLVIISHNNHFEYRNPKHTPILKQIDILLCLFYIRQFFIKKDEPFYIT